METPFDKVHKQCSTFAWNLLSSIQVLEATKLNIQNEHENIAFDMLIEHHCKYLLNEVPS